MLVAVIIATRKYIEMIDIYYACTDIDIGLGIGIGQSPEFSASVGDVCTVLELLCACCLSMVAAMHQAKPGKAIKSV